MTREEPDNTAHLLSQARRAINEHLAAEMENAGITGFVSSHGDIISTLLKHSPMTMTELAQAIRRDRSTVTTLVKKLHQQGYVQLQENPRDTRSRLVSMTPKGMQLKDKFHSISIDLANTIWRGISEEERDQFRSTLKTIINNFS